jgi:hypothetical protein
MIEDSENALQKTRVFRRATDTGSLNEADRVAEFQDER